MLSLARPLTLPWWLFVRPVWPEAGRKHLLERNHSRGYEFESSLPSLRGFEPARLASRAPTIGLPGLPPRATQRGWIDCLPVEPKDHFWVVRRADGTAVGAHPSQQAASECPECSRAAEEGHRFVEEEAEWVSENDVPTH